MASSRIYSGAGFVHTGAIRQPDPSSFEHRLVNRFAYPQSRTRSDPACNCVVCTPGRKRLLHRETRVQENQAMTAPTPAPSDLVRPFRVAISDSEIADLKQRLARTRWPDP